MITRNHSVNVTRHLTDDSLVVVTSVCPWCGKASAFEVDKEVWNTGWKAYNAGANIQDAWPTLSPSERELILTGICDDCWDKM